MKLEDINTNFFAENENIECKGMLDRNNVIGWLKTVGGFSNSKGGILYVGVENDTHKLIGFGPKELDKEKLYFINTVSQHARIIPQYEIETIIYDIRESKRAILKITIPESKVKPIIIMYEQMPLIYMRRDGLTNAATLEEISYMATHFAQPKFDTQITNKIFDTNNFKKLSEFYKSRHDQEDISAKKLAAIGFFDDSNRLSKGASLFEDSYTGDDTKVTCSLYSGVTRGDDKILASNSFTGNLIECLEFMTLFIERNSNHGFVKTDNGRIDIDAFPKRSVFEALINSVAHRDYTIEGSQISVDIFKNRLTITSPGSLYNGGDIKETRDIASLISRRRNENLCSILILCNAMEAKGTGFEKIIEDYSDADLNHKPIVVSKNNQFSIILPDLTCDDGVKIGEDGLLVDYPVEKLGKYGLSILTFCFSTPKSAKEIATYLELSDSSFFRKDILGTLVETNLLVETKDGRTSLYASNKEKITIR